MYGEIDLTPDQHGIIYHIDSICIRFERTFPIGPRGRNARKSRLYLLRTNNCRYEEKYIISR